MTKEEIIEEAILIKGGWAASIRWAIEQERESCAKIVEESSLPDAYSEPCLLVIAEEIRARGNT
jgi:hypothetical protein